ncbi:hypothetical protein SALBM311S_01451 [Streptomyces alboniger]
MQPAALTALLGLLLSGTAAVGSYALVVPLVVLQAVTAAGWFRLNGMWPARQGIALAFLGALVADAALLVAGRENGPAAILGTLGVWVLLSLVLQLRSHAPRDERMYGLMATVASAALSIVAAGHLAAEPDAVTVGAAAVAVAVLARALPCRPGLRGRRPARRGRRGHRGRPDDRPGCEGRAAGRGRGGVRADRAPGGELRLSVQVRALHGGSRAAAGGGRTGGVPAGAGARLTLW